MYKVKRFFKDLFEKKDVVRKKEDNTASLEQVKEAVRRVDERFGRAITRLSER